MCFSRLLAIPSKIISAYSSSTGWDTTEATYMIHFQDHDFGPFGPPQSVPYRILFVLFLISKIMLFPIPLKKVILCERK